MDEARRMVDMDESWRMFSHRVIASGMRQSCNLARRTATIYVLVMHRLGAAEAGVPVDSDVRTALVSAGDPR